MELLKYVITLLTCGALYGFIQFLITRHDNRKNNLKNIEAKIDAVSKEVTLVRDEQSEFKATLARTHILRFHDELKNGISHSDEYFRQQILDIDTYNRYCETHPKFANGVTVMASEHIIDEYRKTFLTTDHDESA